jgi:short-subunit dehydrogenase
VVTFLCTDKKENIDILINNAGFGDFGYLTDTDLNKDLNMINTNVKAVHILTKSIVKDLYEYMLLITQWSCGSFPGRM